MPVRVYLAAPLGEVCAGRFGLVHGGLGLLGLLALVHDFARFGELVAQLLGTRIRPRLELGRDPQPAPQGTGQSRSQSGPTGQERERLSHRGRCYTARSSCFARTAGPERRHTR